MLPAARGYWAPYNVHHSLVNLPCSNATRRIYPGLAPLFAFIVSHKPDLKGRIDCGSDCSDGTNLTLDKDKRQTIVHDSFDA